MIRHTIYGQLVAVQEEQYTQYVFKNLDETEDSWDRYIMVTKCPNWQSFTKPELGQNGYLTFEPVDAGNTYYNVNTDSYEQYKHTAYYFIDFVKEQQKIDVKDFKF